MKRTAWPYIVVILCSFILGAAWGWKLIQDRKAQEGKLEAEGHLRVLAPPGVFSQELLLEFQRRERVEVDVATDPFPASLLRRALKSAPRQFDLVFVYHYQVPELRGERKITTLYDSRNKFPTTIAPDFRKLGDDRNLLETAPILWGFLGTAGEAKVGEKLAIGFWPSGLLALESSELSIPNAVIALTGKLQASNTVSEARLREGISRLAQDLEKSEAPAIVSHGQLEFPPLKGRKFMAMGGQYPLWILTGAATTDGDMERSRRFIRYLLDPAINAKMVMDTQGAASTLRSHDDAAKLPERLQSQFLRTVPIDQIKLERDERLRQADEMLEQWIQGASLKAPAKTKAPSAPQSHDD